MYHNIINKYVQVEYWLIRLITNFNFKNQIMELMKKFARSINSFLRKRNLTKTTIKIERENKHKIFLDTLTFKFYKP